jgi:hypothetical protein
MLTVLDDNEKPMHTLGKDSWRSPRKIDGAMAAVLAWEARGDAIAAGDVDMFEQPVKQPEKPKPSRFIPGEALPATAMVPSGSSPPMGSMS